MVAPFDNVAVHDHKNFRTLAHSGKPVGHSQREATFAEGVQVLLDNGFGASVHGGCGLIENQDGRVPQYRSGQGDPLAFPAGELHGSRA